MSTRPVLVVDDDADSRLLIASAVRVRGYPVETAENGSEALRRLVFCHPFVIVLDLEMPIMDGRSFRRIQQRLGTDLASIPVILCSGYTVATDIPELQPFACLPKPLPDFDPLLERIDAALRLAA